MFTRLLTELVYSGPRFKQTHVQDGASFAVELTAGWDVPGVVSSSADRRVKLHSAFNLSSKIVN